MTILFSGNKAGDKKNYSKIIDGIRKLGHQVKTRKLFPVFDSKNSFKRELELCDFMICEVSDRSLSLGLEIATAISKNKHVLILTKVNQSLDDLSEFLRENASRYTHIVTYSEETLEAVLDAELKKIRKRLNYVLYVELPSQYGDMIEAIQKNTNKSKKEIIEDALKAYSPQIDKI